ncbi:MAG: ABC transporter ATP-binding protein [Cyclobacteriaceae bacterium]|jgi:iron complex transport system ATP-binding protein|nr:ABC transporter ATP-binding protein [Cyclobacteriaceae bacterium]
MNSTKTSGIPAGSVLLRTENLSVGFHKPDGDLVLFDDLNLELQAGQLVCFMGTNGIGKSSLIKTLAGLLEPLSGNRKLFDTDSFRKGPEPAFISVVLTDNVSALNMSVYDLVMLGRYPFLNWSMTIREADQAIFQQAIKTIRIEHLVNKRLFELSDGQLQMAMLARALTQDTPILLLDEPTAHLDLNNRVEIMNLLRGLAHETGKAIVVATHELDLALQTADLIWLAGNTKKIITGIPEDLVLDGSFDSIFQFKGFDLKTGKVQHVPWRNVSVELKGDGHVLLWTKNALERNGYQVVPQAPIQVVIHLNDGNPNWQLGDKKFSSLNRLLEAMGSLPT